MAFQSEKETEYWLKPMWAELPKPDGARDLVQNTRRFWSSYWYLRDRCGYSDKELAAYAEQISRSRALPYELGS